MPKICFVWPMKLEPVEDCYDDMQYCNTSRTLFVRGLQKCRRRIELFHECIFKLRICYHCAITRKGTERCTDLNRFVAEKCAEIQILAISGYSGERMNGSICDHQRASPFGLLERSNLNDQLRILTQCIPPVTHIGFHNTSATNIIIFYKICMKCAKPYIREIFDSESRVKVHLIALEKLRRIHKIFNMDFNWKYMKFP